MCKFLKQAKADTCFTEDSNDDGMKMDDKRNVLYGRDDFAETIPLAIDLPKSSLAFLRHYGYRYDSC